MLVKVAAAAVSNVSYYNPMIIANSIAVLNITAATMSILDTPWQLAAQLWHPLLSFSLPPFSPSQCPEHPLASF